jgi:formate/nitrite transporter FocA (FNT family)
MVKRRALNLVKLYYGVTSQHGLIHTIILDKKLKTHKMANVAGYSKRSIKAILYFTTSSLQNVAGCFLVMILNHWRKLLRGTVPLPS